MPMQSGNSDFYKRMKPETDQAVRKAAGDPAKPRGIKNLPAGIMNGVARLAECGFFKYKADTTMKLTNGKSAVGEYYFRASGVVLEPEEVEVGVQGKVRVAGLQTSVMVNCFDTKSGDKVVTQAENLVVVENYLKLLGASKEALEEGVANFEAIAEALKDKDNPVYFEFTTSQGKANPPKYPTPRTFENWGKKIDYDLQPSSNGFVDGTGAATTETAQESPDSAEATEETQDVAEESAPELTDEEPQQDVAQTVSELELAKLVKAADAKVKSKAKLEAATILNNLAIKLGIPKETVEAADDYASVAAMITEAQGGVQVEESAPEQTNIPKVGEVYGYQKTDKDGNPLKDKNGKQFKPTSITIKKVNETDSTCDAISNVDKKPINGIPFDRLLPPT